MNVLDEKSCAICAWRETCQKRFSQAYDIALNCPDYTFDLTLRNKIADENEEKGEGDKKLEKK